MGEYHCTNDMAKFQAAVPEGFRQKVKGPMDYWSVPSIWGGGREYEAGGRDLQLLRASCFWLCGEGCCLDNGEEVFLAIGVPSRECRVYLVALLQQESGTRVVER